MGVLDVQAEFGRQARSGGRPGVATGTFVAAGDLNGNGADAVLRVPASAGLVRKLTVFVAIEHGYDGDIDISLTHVPSGRTLELWSDVGSVADGFMVTIDDDAFWDIGTASNPSGGAITGWYNPEGFGFLSTFNGIDASGQWKLTLTDDSITPGGTLLAWHLNVTY